MYTKWRLLLTGENNGAWNMALDEALLISAGSNNDIPTLRLYTWNPPTLSLGFAQPVRDVDIDRLSIEGWDLVRRPTGGRAILHTDELTYSVTAPVDHPFFTGGLLDSYRRISSAILKALEYIGVSASADKEYTSFSKDAKANPVCFETPSNYEITVNGKKLIGSAQARKNGGVLQHGSLPITGDLTRITKVLVANPSITKESLLEKAGTLETVSGNLYSFQDVEDAFVHGFIQTFDIDFKKGEATIEERSIAEMLLINKYTSDSWNHRI